MRHNKVCLLIILILINVLFCFGASIDTISLKNGSVIKGTIIEHKLGQFLKVQTKDGSIYVFQESEVTNIKKEEEAVPQLHKYDTTGAKGRVCVTQLSGMNYIGMVEAVNPDSSLMLKVYGDESPVRIKAENIYSITPKPFPHTGNFGIGLGIPYGTFGFNSDLFIGDHFALTAGYGTAIFTSCWEAGTKFYLRGSEKTWRPRLTALWGVNSVIIILDDEGNADLVEKFTGLTLGVGQQWMWGETKHNGLDLDVMYITTTDMFDRAEVLRADGYHVSKSGRTKISIGYKYSF